MPFFARLRLPAALALPLILASCGKADKKLLGHWTNSDAAYANMPGGVPTIDIDATDFKHKEMGTLSYKYKVLKVEGDDVTLQLDQGFGQPTLFVATVKGDTLAFEREKNRGAMLGGTSWKRN